jgi:superfamily I DNA/RNA helicase
VRGKIAFANVHDAKGNDGDVVLLIEPDDSGASTLNKRALFYVAATRAKEHLIVLGVATANSAKPILEDAASTANVLAKLGY